MWTNLNKFNQTDMMGSVDRPCKVKIQCDIDHNETLNTFLSQKPKHYNNNYNYSSVDHPVSVVLEFSAQPRVKNYNYFLSSLLLRVFHNSLSPDLVYQSLSKSQWCLNTYWLVIILKRNSYVTNLIKHILSWMSSFVYRFILVDSFTLLKWPWSVDFMLNKCYNNML